MQIWMEYIGESALPRRFLSIALGSPPHIIGWLKPPVQIHPGQGIELWLNQIELSIRRVEEHNQSHGYNA